MLVNAASHIASFTEEALEINGVFLLLTCVDDNDRMCVRKLKNIIFI